MYGAAFAAEADGHALAETRIRLDSIAQLNGGRERAHGVVAVRGPRAEDSHHGISDELLDGAAVGIDDFLGNRVVARQQGTQILRVKRFAQCGRAGDIREQDGHDAAFVAHCAGVYE